MNDYFRLTAIHLEHLLLNEEAQIKGVVAVFNFKGFGVYHLTQYTPWVVRKFVRLAQDYCPMRIKAVYVINNPSAFVVLFSLVKVFMKTKLLQRTHFLGYDVEKMRQLIPHDVIPEEDGGSL
ncbi:retinaldehyde-binding protein 1-like [Haemaphysalis longicornis]